MSHLLPYNIYYENTAGEKLVLSELPFVVTSGKLFDAKWKLNTVQRHTGEGARLLSARHAADEKTMTVKVAARNAEHLSGLLRRMSDVFDRDVTVLKPGRLWVNGQYMTCWCSARQKELSCDFTSSAAVTVSVMPESPVWCSEKTFTMSESSEDASDAKSYDYDYPYRYADAAGAVMLENTCWQPCPMRIMFKGPAEQPAVYINDVQIGINSVLEAGECAVIDQMSREIYKTDANGTKTNIFNKRIKNGQTFEWLPAGKNTAYYEGSGEVEIVVIEQRSEPQWTSN